MDYSKFKKISSDDSCTMLKHEKGHELKIAHNGLTKKMRQDLDKLPLHKADGGDVKDDSSDQSQQKGPVVINVGQPAQAPQPQQPGLAAGAQPPQAEPPPQDPDMQQVAQASPDPSQSPAVDQEVGDAQNSYGQPAPPVPQDQQQAPQPPPMQQELNQESQAWLQDLQNGHIKPETYHDLYENKGTLGKIGTIFGLLLGGAGSGLTHQPNAALEMMNNEINRDLEAQKTSKSNAQNFLRINQEMGLNAAKISQMQKEGNLTDAQAQGMLAEANIKNFTLTQNQMLLTTYHDLTQNVGKMPDGPQKQQAQAVLGMLYQQIGSKINNANDAAAGAASFLKMMNPGSSGGSDEQNFQNKTRALKLMGPQGETMSKDMESKHVPGLQGQASVPLNDADRDAINSGVTFDQKLHRFMDWTKSHSGDLSPSDKNAGQALAAELQGAYRQATHGGVYKEGEQNFISKLIDSNPTKFFNEIRVMPQLKAIAGENQQRIDQLVKSKGFSGYQSPSSGGSAAETKMINGAQYKKVEGGWQKVK